MSEDRYEKGWAKLREIAGEEGQKVVDGLKDVAPDLGRYVVEFGFGDIYCRSGLDVKTRQVVAISALSAMGNSLNQLKPHIHGALNVGLSRAEVVEIVIQIALHSGFPAALRAMGAVKEVFADRDQKGMS
ncbi:MAG: carboxymuconolactone decarboxylase family protein [Thermodesulfobacteriota bacterium]